MTILEEILTVAQCFSDRGWTEGERSVMTTLCQAALDRWESRLREGLSPQDCRGPFVTACAWSALGAMQGGWEAGAPASFTAGDLTVRLGGGTDAAARSLEAQAAALLDAADRAAAGFTVPAKGLCLLEVKYK